MNTPEIEVIKNYILDLLYQSECNDNENYKSDESEDIVSTYCAILEELHNIENDENAESVKYWENILNENFHQLYIDVTNYQNHEDITYYENKMRQEDIDETDNEIANELENIFITNEKLSAECGFYNY